MQEEERHAHLRGPRGDLRRVPGGVEHRGARPGRRAAGGEGVRRGGPAAARVADGGDPAAAHVRQRVGTRDRGDGARPGAAALREPAPGGGDHARLTRRIAREPDVLAGEAVPLA